MNRGEVWWVRFDPSIGGEIKKTRPAIVISNDQANKYLNRLQVIPLTSKIDRLYPSEVFVTLEGNKAKALADQITTVSKLRLTNLIGKLSASDIRAVEAALRRHLAL